MNPRRQVEMASPWAVVKYPFGYLLTNKHTTKTPTLNGTTPTAPDDFAFLWLYVMMADPNTNDEALHDINTLSLGLWGRYCDDARFVGVDLVDGQTFMSLVCLVYSDLQEDGDDMENFMLNDNGDNTEKRGSEVMTELLWETCVTDVYEWWRRFHQRCLETKVGMYDPR